MGAEMRAADTNQASAKPRGSFVWMTLLAATLTAGTGLLAEALGEGPRAQAREDSADDAARERMLALGWHPLAGSSRVRGVELLTARSGFELPLGHGMVTGASATPEQVAFASRIVREELARLPAALLAAAELRRVVLCGSLREDRRPIPSLPNYNRTLLLDADAEETYLRRLVHHEIFHFIDLADDGSVLRDPAWTALNPAGFRYGQGGRAMRGPEASVDPPPPGFVSGYAMASLEEDKAEVFAEMMTGAARLRERAARDSVLHGKIARIRELTQALASESENLW
jgi:hypothetical protein